MLRIEKMILIFILILTYSSVVLAQTENDTIPNAGFEKWIQYYGVMAPEGWFFSWSTYGGCPVTKSFLSHTGEYSVKGEVISPNFPSIIPNLVSTQPFAENRGFSVSQNHPALEGYYRFQSLSGDELWISVSMIYGQFNEVGYGLISIDTTTSSYTPFIVPISYFSDDPPNYCEISARIAAGPNSTDVHKGSYFLLDDLSFSETTSVMSSESSLPLKFKLHQNYPNPFNPETVINYSLPQQSHVTLEVFNITGDKVVTLVNGQTSAGYHSVNWNGRDSVGQLVSAGIYLCRLQAGTHCQTIRMLMLK